VLVIFHEGSAREVEGACKATLSIKKLFNVGETPSEGVVKELERKSVIVNHEPSTWSSSQEVLIKKTNIKK
jgi:hypothetical protein